MSWSHPDYGHQAGGEMESQHKSGKPQARKTLCGATDTSPALPRDPGRATLSFQGDFGQGSQHAHIEKQRVLGTPSSLLFLLCSQPHAKTLPHRGSQQSLCQRALTVGALTMGALTMGALTVGVFEHLIAHWLCRDILEDSGDRERCYFEVHSVAYPRGGIGSWQQDKLSQQALGKWEQRDGDQVQTDHRMATAGNSCLGFPA